MSISALPVVLTTIIEDIYGIETLTLTREESKLKIGIRVSSCTIDQLVNVSITLAKKRKSFKKRKPDGNVDEFYVSILYLGVVSLKLKIVNVKIIGR